VREAATPPLPTIMGEMLPKEHDPDLASLCIGGGQGMAAVLEKP
jgi:acetyl-CoA acetyltransferase